MVAYSHQKSYLFISWWILGNTKIFSKYIFTADASQTRSTGFKALNGSYHLLFIPKSGYVLNETENVKTALLDDDLFVLDYWYVNISTFSDDSSIDLNFSIRP